MNGVHDMGGMHGFGPVLPEANEPVFHAPWEGRVRGMFVLMGAWRRWNIDASRHAIEQLPPADYLRYSYFEKWFDALVALSLNAGIITAEELASGHKAAGTAAVAPPITADTIWNVITATGSFQRKVAANPRFAAGDQVRTRNINPEGHTRLPRYVPRARRHDRAGPWRACLPGLQRPLRRRSATNPLHRALRSARTLGRGGQPGGPGVSGPVGGLP